MQIYPVVSTIVTSIGYDESTLALRVQFKNGIYDYWGVPKHIFLNFLNAPSKGKFYARFIKGHYPCQRLM